jgi:hypothetical protein
MGSTVEDPDTSMDPVRPSDALPIASVVSDDGVSVVVSEFVSTALPPQAANRTARPLRTTNRILTFLPMSILSWF